MDHVDVLHGVELPDPYRWLEDDNAPETEAWVQAQNKVTFNYLNQIKERDAIRNRLTELWNYERYGIPMKKGGRLFFMKNNGLQNQSVLFVQDTELKEPRILLDPNTLSNDGTVALGNYAVSPDGQWLAYSLSKAGSDWKEWHVKHVETGTDLSDLLEWSKFSGASWDRESLGFYYSKYDAPTEDDTLQGTNYHQKLYYHRLNTPQSEDELIYHRPDQKEWGFGGKVTEDGQFLCITVWQGTDPKNRFYYKSLQEADSEVVELLNDFDAEYEYLANEGDQFIFKTNLDSDRGKVILIDLSKPDKANWKTLVDQTEDTLESASVVGDNLILTYLHNAGNKVMIHSLNGQLKYALALPAIGSTGGFAGDRKDSETFFSFTNFTVPGTVYRLNLSSGEYAVYKEPKVLFDPHQFVSEQVFYESKDGTRIPMFLTRKRDLKVSRETPVLLYGYGGFNISLTPSFSVTRLVFLEMGGVFALANLRGGGEYGEAWHKAGTKLQKQNVFDDFIAGAEWLIQNQYTSSSKLAIMGGSNGGLLVGACMTQRPELFAVALPAVGVLDMLRFHKFTIGWAWTSDYGSPENEKEFTALHAYSPYHRLKKGTRYPSTLITTADHDDRVVPAHSFKFAAALQKAHSGDNPVLIRIETRAGHGAGKPTSKRIDEAADQLAFICRELDLTQD